MDNEIREHHVGIEQGEPTSSSGNRVNEANLTQSISEVRSSSEDNRTDRRREVHLAVLKGNWKKATQIYSTYRNEINYDSIISKRKETVLHIAVTAPTDNVEFVEKVVQMMSDEALATPDDAKNTAFFVAVIAGKLEFAKVMIKKKPDLAMIRGGKGERELPLYMAASRGHTEMVRWLYNIVKSELKYEDKIDIFVALISSNIYDVALQMLKEDNRLATGRDNNQETGLHALAQKTSLTADLLNIPPPDDILSLDMPTEKISCKNFIWKYPLVQYKRYAHKKGYMGETAFELVRCILNEVLQLDDSEISDLIDNPWSAIFIAARKGNVELLTVLIDFYPDLLSKVDNKNHTIFHIAVLHRQEDIFRLIHEFYSIKEKIATYIDSEDNNMLHLAAQLPLTANRLHVVPGAALQLQRELLWFKEVEKVVPLKFRLEAKNSPGKTPLEAKISFGRTPEDLFMESHKYLLKEGEIWMRGTADKCMLVATLIATVVFAAAFTVPGGNQQDTGIPIFLRNIVFKFFFIADAVSFVSSVASVMIFLGILTSRCQLNDFYMSLPHKLIIGLTTLFISLVSMLMAFVAVGFLVFNHGKSLIWFAIPITVISSGPIILFMWMHSRLFIHAWIQTLASQSIFKPNAKPIPIQVTERESLGDVILEMCLMFGVLVIILILVMAIPIIMLTLRITVANW